MGYDCSETTIDHIGGSPFCSITASEQWSVNAVKKMLEEHPDEVKLMHTNPDGSMVVHAPFKCMQYLRFPKKRDMTEEQRIAQIERGKKLGAGRKKAMQERKNSNSNGSDNSDDSDEENEFEDDDLEEYDENESASKDTEDTSKEV